MKIKVETEQKYFKWSGNLDNFEELSEVKCIENRDDFVGKKRRKTID